MPPRYVVVDGSNIATEGRSVPSLAQLDEAVRAFMQERPDDQVIVVVDASFGYRIDESERREYEAAEAAGEIVSPPAGAIGRGDKFLLQIADRTSAVVLSNDSFQEFHAEYGWLFDQGRLMGGKPVPGVGWIFTARAPVRGPRSREALRAAKKGQRGGVRRATVAEGPVADAIAEATAEVIAPHSEEDAPADETAEDEATKGGRRGRRRHSKPAGTVNDPLPFIEFIAEHPLGSEVTGEVDSFTSHGAFVRVANARCYVPLVALGDPAPRSAKEVLKRGEIRPFVVQALDPPRRGIELAMPGVARVAGTPTEETVEADIGAGRKSKSRRKAPEPAPEAVVEEAVAAAAASAASEPVPAKPRRSRKKAAEPVFVPDMEEPPPPARPTRRTRKTAAAVVVDAGPDAEVVTMSEPVVEEPAPARPRRTRRKATEPAVTEPEPTPAEPAPAPAARAKRSRKKAPAAPVAAEPATPAEPEPAPAPAAEKPRRTRKAAAKAAPVVQVEPEAEPQPEPPPAKKSRSRRKAAEPPAEAPAPEPPPVKKSRARKKSAG